MYYQDVPYKIKKLLNTTYLKLSPLKYLFPVQSYIWLFPYFSLFFCLSEYNSQVDWSLETNKPYFWLPVRNTRQKHDPASVLDGSALCAALSGVIPYLIPFFQSVQYKKLLKKCWTPQRQTIQRKLQITSVCQRQHNIGPSSII